MTRLFEVGLSFGQVRLWTMSRIEENSAAYNMPIGLRLKGQLNKSALIESLTYIVERHESLRTLICENEQGDPIGYVVSVPEKQALIHETDLKDCDPLVRENQAFEHIQKISKTPFNLSSDIPLRVELIALTPTEHVLVVVMHHHASDATSAGLFLSEMTRAYDAFSLGLTPDLAALPIQYSDWAVWQQDTLDQDLPEKIERARQRLLNVPDFLSLPLDHGRHADRERRVGYVPIEIEANVAERLHELAKACETTLFTIMLSMYAVLLSRLAGQTTVVVGFPVGGRSLIEMEQVIGFMVNTLVAPVYVNPRITARELFALTRSSVNDVLSDQDLPFERLVEDLGGARSLTHTPIFQALLSLQDAAQGSPSLNGLEVTQESIVAPTAKHDLTLFLTRNLDHTLQGVFEFDADLFDIKNVEGWAASFSKLLQQVVQAPDTMLVNLALRESASIDPNTRSFEIERENLNRPNNDQIRLSEFLMSPYQKNSSSIAIVFNDERISYGELEARANQLARYLLHKGVGANHIVGVLLRREPRLIVTMLAVLKTGAAYLPLDPNYPVARLDFMLQDSGASTLVTDGSTSFSTDCSLVDLSLAEVTRQINDFSHTALSGTEVSPEEFSSDLAYVIYTSGSTGTPKGVAITRSALSLFLQSVQNRIRLSESDRFLALTTICFDISVLEIFVPLMQGAEVVLLNQDDSRDPSAIGRAIVKFDVTAVQATPSLWSGLLEQVNRDNLKILVGGEALTHELAQSLLKFGDVYNLYGPTEATVWASCLPVTANLKKDSPYAVSIGLPLNRYQMFVLDSTLQPLPDGVVGELYISSEALARGYLNRGGLTAERFIASPFNVGQRMYRTGDLVRRQHDNTIDFLGRIDDQVKIRGYRIELGEIEAALLKVSTALSQVAVIARSIGGHLELVAYLVADLDHEIQDVSELQTALGRLVPEYMVPAYYVTLEALPLTANGKLNRRALPDPESKRDRVLFRAPQTPQEILLCRLFEEVTGAENVGIDDNFFSIGGQSIFAMRLVARVRQECGLTLPLRSLFSDSTPARLGLVLAALNDSASCQLVAGLGDIGNGAVVLSYGQKRLWALDSIDEASAVYNIPSLVDIDGGVNVALLKTALLAFVRRHQSLRTVIQLDVDGMPIGRVLEDIDADALLKVYDLSRAPDVEITLTPEVIIEREANTSFDLAKDISLRGSLIIHSDSQATLALTMHHQAGDAVSTGLMLRELFQAYEAYLAGTQPSWVSLPVQYSDWAAWQQFNVSRDLDEKIARARLKFASMPSCLTLPLDFPRRMDRKRRAGYQSFSVSVEMTQKLERLAKEQTTTLFTLILAGYASMLARLSGQSSVVIGTPVTGRSHTAVDGLVGLMINTLALPLEVPLAGSGLSLIAVAKECLSTGLLDQDFPFDRLVEVIGVQRSLNHTPLFQAMLAFHDGFGASIEVKGLSIKPKPALLSVAKFDLTLHVSTSTDRTLHCSFEYDADLFSERSVLSWSECFLEILNALTADPQRVVCTYPYMDTLSRRKLINESKVERADIVADPLTVVELLEDRFVSSANDIALEFESQQMTYGELDKKTSQFGRYLISLGVGPDVVVAVLLERDIDLIVAILAINKAGGAYVPLDADYPVSRLEFILKDTLSAVLITSDDKQLIWGQLVPDVAMTSNVESVPKLVNLSQTNTQEAISYFSEAHITQTDRLRPLRPDNLFYVMYTSGSTGQPKGVGFLHQSMANLIQWQKKEITNTARRVLQYSPIGFDASAQEIVWAFYMGATLILIDDERRRDAAALLEYIAEKKIEHLYAPYVVLNNLAEAHNLFDIAAWPDQIFTAGEQLQITPSIEKVFKTHSSSRLHNFYGPTESHVVSNYSLGSNPQNWEVFPPIGTAIWNTSLFILDSALELVPRGVVGELYIGGQGLARGYFNRSGLTAERFIANPFEVRGAGRLYRTGDLARLRPDGEIEFLGRADQQIKIRGYRIEPGEVESVLLRMFQEVAKVAVLAVASTVTDALTNSSGDLQLVAYLVAREQGQCPSDKALRDALAVSLPDYMIPTAFIEVSDLPKTVNGKLDRAALPAPRLTASVVGHREPTTQTERMICSLFESLTGHAKVGLDDDFFLIGGHSLLAMRLVASLRDQLGVTIRLRTLFEAPTVGLLASALNDMSAERTSTLKRGPGRVSFDEVALSYAQVRLATVEQIDGVSAAYNMASVVRLKGVIDSKALAEAVCAIAQRHEALRTLIVIDEDGVLSGRIVQGISPEQVFSLVDLESEGQSGDRRSIFDRIRKLINTPFDVSQELSIKTQLLRVSSHEHYFVVVFYHGAADGLSTGIFCRELSQAYNAFKVKQEPQWRALSITYSDWAQWQRDTIHSELDALLERARKRLANVPEQLSLPTDYLRTEGRSREAGYVAIHFDQHITNGLTKLAGTHRTSLFAVLLTLYGITLSRLSLQESVAIGFPMSSRDHLEIENLIGIFLNVLVIPIYVSRCHTVGEILGSVRDELEQVLSDQQLPFEKLVDELVRDRTIDNTPLFQTMFSFQIVEGKNELELDNLIVESESFELAQAKYDLSLYLTKTPDGALSGTFEFDASLFLHEHVQGWVSTFENIVRAATHSPESVIASLSSHSTSLNSASQLTSASKIQPVFAERRLFDLFERHVMATPNARAVLYKEEVYTYKQLAVRSSQLANDLILAGIEQEGLVGVYLPCCPNLVSVILAILKCGAVYMPLDTEHPLERTQFVLEDSRPQCLITDSSLVDAAKIEILNRVCDASANIPSILDLSALMRSSVTGQQPEQSEDVALRQVSVNEQQLAYLFYTSGSTGRPKGVAGTVRALLNRLDWACDEFPIGPSETLIARSAIGFIDGLTEILSALTQGRVMRLIDTEDAKDPVRLLAAMSGHSPVRVNTVPALIAALIDAQASRTDDIRIEGTWISSGEQLSRSLAAKCLQCFPSVRLFNLYGMTEAAGDSSLAAISGTNISIGFPIAGTRLHILDERLEVVPRGVFGELYIEGKGLARGYLRNTALTAERFLANPFAVGQRMYRTGDVARVRGDGSLEYLGRADRQVKIRGHRVEVAEVESLLREAFPELRDIAVVLKQTRSSETEFVGVQTQLVAYLVKRAGSSIPSSSKIQQQLRARLPEAAIPAFYVELDSLPLNANGKLDTASLPLPDINLEVVTYRAPRSMLERLCCRWFSEFTGVVQVGLDDSFFALGGQSLLAMRLLSQIYKETGLTLPLRILFSSATPELLAAELEILQRNLNKEKFYSPLILLKKGTGPTSLFCVHPGGGSGSVYFELAARMPKEISIWGLQARGLEAGQLPHQTVDEMVVDYIRAIKTVQAVGPYQLLGWSFGGLIAHRLATELEAAGDTVSVVVLFDSLLNVSEQSGSAQLIPADISHSAFLNRWIEDAIVAGDVQPKQVVNDEASKLELIKGVLVRKELLTNDASLDTVDRIMQQFRLNIRRAQQLKPTLSKAEIMLFTAQRDRAEHAIDALNWKPHTVGAFRSVSTPFTHAEMVSTQASAYIVPILLAHLSQG